MIYKQVSFTTENYIVIDIVRELKKMVMMMIIIIIIITTKYFDTTILFSGTHYMTI